MNSGQYPGGPQYPQQQMNQGYNQGYPQQQMNQGYNQGYQQQGYGQHGYMINGQPVQPPQKKKSVKGLVIGLVIGVSLLLITLFTLFVVLVVKVDKEEGEGFSRNYFAKYNWSVKGDSNSVIVPDDDGTYIWYRDITEKDGDYYAGKYKVRTGERAIEYLTEDSEADDFSISEKDIKDMEDEEYGATEENFVTITLTCEESVFYGKKSDAKDLSIFYGFFVDDKDGKKLTMLRAGNPLEYNFLPEDKDD